MTPLTQACLALLFASTSAAALAGTVSGTITENGTGTPIRSGLVRLYTSSGSSYGIAFPDNAGAYSFTAVPNGTYYARTEGTNYYEELWNNLPCPKGICTPASGTPIAVGAGTSTVNFALDRGGVITGTLKASGSQQPISDGLVRVYYANGTQVGIVFPDASGTWLMGGLAAGNYFVRTGDTGYYDELWDNKPCAHGNCTTTTGTPVVVAANGTSTANFVLDPGGIIAGAITEAGTNAPISDGFVRIYRSNGVSIGLAFPDNAGNYRFGGLEAGSYFARTDDTSYNDELWNDRPCLQDACTVTTGTPITVAMNATTTASFALARGGGIQGTVSQEATGLPISDGLVRIYNGSGAVLGITFPDNAGHYEYGGLPAGNYYARTEQTDHLDELYNGFPCPQRVCTPTSGTPITVGSSNVIANFVLAKGGSVSGTLRAAGSSLPITSGLVRIFDSNGTSLGISFPDLSGAFEYGGLAPGTYYARTESTGYFDELWNDRPCHQGQCVVTSGTPIPVNNAAATVNFVLSSGDAIFANGFQQ